MWPYLAGWHRGRVRQPVEPPRARRAGGPRGRGGPRDRSPRRSAAGPPSSIFTSGGTESDNLAIKGIALATPRGRHLVTTPTEHEAVLESADYLRRHHGFDVTELPVDADGLVDPSALEAALRPDTTLVSIAHANNELGTVQPIAELAAIARAAGVPFHTDAVQSAGWLDVGLAQLGVDALSVTGHKLGAPKGIGVLAVRGAIPLEPVLHGGGQERGRRSGTENVAGIVGLAEAFRLAAGTRAAADAVAGLRDVAHRRRARIRAVGDPDRLARAPAAEPRGLRVPGHERRSRSARTRTARDRLLERVRLRGRKRRAVARAARDRPGSGCRAHLGALHARHRDHARRDRRDGRPGRATPSPRSRTSPAEIRRASCFPFGWSSSAAQRDAYRDHTCCSVGLDTRPPPAGATRPPELRGSISRRADGRRTPTAAGRPA